MTLYCMANKGLLGPILVNTFRAVIDLKFIQGLDIPRTKSQIFSHHVIAVKVKIVIRYLDYKMLDAFVKYNF